MTPDRPYTKMYHVRREVVSRSMNHAFIGKVEYREMIDEETGQDFSEHVYIRSETLAERLIEKMKAKNKINLSHWIDITNDPAYQ